MSFKFKYILQKLWGTEISSSYCQPEDSVVLWIEDGISSECFSYISRKKENYKKGCKNRFMILDSFFLGGANRNNFDDVRMILISNEGKTKYTCESKLGRAVRCRDHKLVFGPEIGKRFC